MSDATDQQGTGFTPSRRTFLLGTAGVAAGALTTVGLDASAASAATVPGIPTDFEPVVSLAAREKTLIGIGYETWWLPGAGGVSWDLREATPLLGTYRSDDPKVIAQHAEWIHHAGYDFILIDWSNNLFDNWTNGVAEAIIGGTDAVFAEYVKLRKHPKISVMLGMDTNDSASTDHFRDQVALLKSKYLARPEYRELLQEYKGKPLLTIYRGAGVPPDFDDPDFTIRFMNALHETVGDDAGQWSWIDRAPLISGPVTELSAFGEGSVNGGEPKNNGAHVPIAEGETLGQAFHFSGNALTKVTALLATYGSATTSATFTLYRGTPETMLTKVTSTRLTNFADNATQTMSFDPQPAGDYYLELSDPDGTPTWWWYSGADAADVGGASYVNRTAQGAGTILTFAFVGGGSSDGGGLTGWTVGSGWALVPSGTAAGELRPPDGQYPSSRGAAQPGSLTSPAFTVTGDFVSFYAAGQDDAGNTGDKNWFTVRDAASGEILRKHHTPNTTTYFNPTLIDVRDLMGRSVVFQADNGNAGPKGWMAFSNLLQITAEFSVATVGIFGDGGPPSVSSWDVYSGKSRLSGATLVQFMQAMFYYQPEVMLVQQWNEFGPGDENNVSQSNDIEPTVMTKVAGAQSDGWDTYYLDLVRDLIHQYRRGAPFPAVRLDTRYP